MSLHSRFGHWSMHDCVPAPRNWDLPRDDIQLQWRIERESREYRDGSHRSPRLQNRPTPEHYRYGWLEENT